jgi:ribokinase
VPSAPKITVVGSANVDFVARCGKLPRPGETVTDAVLERFPGGKGANQAVAAARLGAHTRFVGRIGRDELVLRSLEREGVDTSGVARDEGESGVALILVEAGGENLIAVAPGANRRLMPGDVDVGEADAVICQLEIPSEAVAAAAAGAPFFCLNAAPARGPLELEPDLLVVNRYEFEVVGPRGRLVALTLGAEGAVLLQDGEEVARARPPPVEAVDRHGGRRRLLRRARRLAAGGPGAWRGAQKGLRRGGPRRLPAGRAAVPADGRRAGRPACRVVRSITGLG